MKGLLLILIYITAASGIEMRSIYNNTEGPGFFCVTVKNSYPMPSDLKGIDKIVWASKPTLVLEMYVEAFNNYTFTVMVTSVKLEKNRLTEGRHMVEYFNVTTMDKKHSMKVYLDDIQQVAGKQADTYGTYNSRFKAIRILYKGPLIFDWDEACPDETQIEEITTKKRQPLTEPPAPPPLATKYFPFNPVTNNALAEDFTTAVTASGLSTKKKVTLSVAVVTVSVSLLVAVVGVIVWKKKKERKMHRRMVSATKAEQTKQMIIHDAKRLSYQEQIKWADNSVGMVTYYAKN